jgi:hypothetical protein|eukprot:COSAG01_NODE_7250_length_3282_cov_7.790763_2_plen_54_part_00
MFRKGLRTVSNSGADHVSLDLSEPTSFCQKRRLKAPSGCEASNAPEISGSTLL